MQSVSFMHVMPPERGADAFTAELATMPPPVRLLTRPILFVDSSVNQRFLSGPVVMLVGSLSAVGTAYSEMPPIGVTRPTALAPPASVNHRLPSGPAVMLPGSPPDPTGNSLTTPAGVIRPIWWASCSVNHRLPSGPLAIDVG